VHLFAEARCWNNASLTDPKMRGRAGRSGYRYEICLYSVAPRFPIGECERRSARPRTGPGGARDTQFESIEGMCVPGTRHYAIEVTATPFGPLPPRPSDDEYTLRTSEPYDCNEPGAWRYLSGSRPSARLGANITVPRCSSANVFCDQHPTGGSGWAAHHIVPAGEGRTRLNSIARQAERAMTFAYSCGLHPNAPPNGVWLRGFPLRRGTTAYNNLDLADKARPYHPRISSASLFQAIANELGRWADEGSCVDDGSTLRAELQSIKTAIANGTYEALPEGATNG